MEKIIMKEVIQAQRLWDTLIKVHKINIEFILNSGQVKGMVVSEIKSPGF